MGNVGKRARSPLAGAIAPLFALAVLGCGARAADGEGEGAGAEGAAQRDDRDEEEASGDEPAELRGGAAGFEAIDTLTLPDCEPGFSRSESARRCNFSFAGVCYETPLAACACACPRRGGSSCVIGGFLNPDLPQRVTCLSL